VTNLLAGWASEPIELEIMLGLLSWGVLLALLFGITRPRAWLVEIPSRLGILALLLGTFGFALGVDLDLIGWRGDKALPGASLFSWGASLCAAGFLGTWFLEWREGRRG
jgi:hypothetical protein